ncbi:MAG: ATP-binding protein, partial [Candidatus Pacebacteria bacterium]|nr:ATP-binding protein [Candidatus Paceibacterota bacterium]
SEAISDELEFDPIRVEQVLNNLLSNAIKYTELGGEVIVHSFLHKKGETLSVEAKDADVRWFVGESEDRHFREISDCVVVSITDSGVGMGESYLKTLFAKFDKDDIVTHKEQKGKGLGLGLIIVKGIVEAHKGVVGVASKESEGSTFYFTINTKQ